MSFNRHKIITENRCGLVRLQMHFVHSSSLTSSCASSTDFAKKAEPMTKQVFSGAS